MSEYKLKYLFQKNCFYLFNVLKSSKIKIEV